MKRFFISFGLKYAIAAIFGILFIFSNLSAQNLPEDAPMLISENTSTRALTAKPNRRKSELPPNVFSPGAKTLITLYVTNLELLPNEDAKAFRVDAQDSEYFRYPLQVVSIEPTVERPWVYALTVRLHNRLGNVGDVLVRVNWRGMASNRARVAIGFEGGKIADDEGAFPTPMPTKPIVKETQNLVGLPWTGDRVRFMEQASFGPKAEIESRLRRIGYAAWINEQTEEKRDGNGALRYAQYPYPNLPLQSVIVPTTCGVQCLRDNYSMYPLQNWFFKEALYGDDFQLRRRAAWSLSQIWVVSGRETVQPSRMLPYLKILDRHAFGNYRDLMREMTLNPAMGNYLDMAISTRNSPNENYAREILQLFSVGLYQLNQDGTPKLDGQGNSIPTYDQNVVNGFTKVFTGWTFCDVGCAASLPGIKNYIDPMILNPANHDPGEKMLLNYPGSAMMIPAGLTAEQDLEQALDNIFYHPNVAPFVSKILIQQLVTSNPTPAYVGRAAAIFNSNSAGVRGDLKSVIRAILLDPEARGNIKTDPDYGKLREPVLYVTNTLRSFNPVAQSSGIGSCQGLSDGVLNAETNQLSQDVFVAPSVFNYYSMENVLPNTNIHAPEFDIFSTGNALKRANYMNTLVFAGGVSRSTDAPCGTNINLARLQTLAETDLSGASLIDTLNREMMHGAMSSQMRGHLLTAIQAVASNNPLKRARTAVYLVGSAPQFQVQR
jgi:uncharacterized protein (DUF1800 family)